MDKIDKIGISGLKKEMKLNKFPTSSIKKLISLIELKGNNSLKINYVKTFLSNSKIGLEGVSEIENLMKIKSDFSLDFTLARGLSYYTSTIFEVVSTDGKKEVKAKVIQGGPLKSKKGVNLPNTNISQPALTEKDIEDAIFAIEQEVDWIALSFVRHAEDLMELEELIKEHSNYKIPIIAKIEKPEAVENIDKIVAYCDGLMVARGDLGVEIPAEEVPLIQKQLVLRAKRARIPVIIATQMMETMITSLTPTRAEVNDVANSVMDGADAVMLSGETSVGQYPVQVIRQMANIIRSVEDSPLIEVPQSPPHIRTKRYITKSICYHAANMANEINAKAISTLTNSGYTAFQISAWRPQAHILVFTSNKRILSQLSLLWGVKAFYYDKYVSTDETIEDVNAIACKKGYLEVGDMLISLAAMPIKDRGMVNTLRVTEIESCSF